MTAPTFAAWTAWLAFLGPEEGVLSRTASDPGNWTGGAVGRGTLVGTKYGISAASYPTLDIAALTLDQANAIRQTDFWDKVRGDELPAPIAFMVTDAAFMSGPDRAIRQMQQALGVSPVDGVLGAHTLAAAHAAKTLDFLDRVRGAPAVVPQHAGTMVGRQRRVDPAAISRRPHRFGAGSFLSWDARHISAATFFATARWANCSG